ncbi:MAG: S-methyl-5'-thioinosine phosphorylase [Gammaproteobacteria bacterium]|jgi:purine nucleoside phosphorylase|nr:S-methyl-5'-thioinosine phosphorylase [Gammaproteobacteria bacterium]
MATTFGLIIGSGWEHLPGADPGAMVETAYGKPSAPVHRLQFGEIQVLTLARHGEGHSLPPHVINYRANVVALKVLGADAVIGLNTVGVVTDLRESGQIAIPDQLLDYTWGREHTIYDGRRGKVEHIDFTEPFSEGLRRDLLAAAARAGVDCHDGGVYAATQGPRLETAAEVDRLERDGADYIGMTAMPEAAIAREVGVDYASIAMIVNRAAGRGDVPIHDDVEASTLAARNATMSLLRAFFEAV